MDGSEQCGLELATGRWNHYYMYEWFLNEPRQTTSEPAHLNLVPASIL